jgi:hypothetical protein
MEPGQAGLAPSFRSTRFAFWRWQDGAVTPLRRNSNSTKNGGVRKKRAVTVNALSFYKFRVVRSITGSFGTAVGRLPVLSRSWPTNDLNKIVGTHVLCECGLHLLCVQFCVSLCCLYRLVKRQAD